MEGGSINQSKIPTELLHTGGAVAQAQQAPRAALAATLPCSGAIARHRAKPVEEGRYRALNYNFSNVIMLVSSLALAVGESLSARGELSVNLCSRT